MGVRSETQFIFQCDRCPNNDSYSGWHEADADGWRKVALFNDTAEDTDDMTWDLICPDDAATLKAWLGNSMRGLM